MSKIMFQSVIDQELLILVQINIRSDLNISVVSKAIITTVPSNIIVVTFRNSADFREKFDLDIGKILSEIYKKYDRYSPKDHFKFYDDHSVHAFTGNRDSNHYGTLRENLLVLKEKEFSFDQFIIEIKFRDSF